MSLIFTTIAMLALGSFPGGQIDRQQLIHLVDAAQEANYQDVAFDYEGRWSWPVESQPERVEQVYTGSFSHRSDGAMLLDVYHFEGESKRASHSVVAILDETTSSSKQGDSDPKASVSIKKQGVFEFAGPGNYRQIWLVDLFRKFARTNYKYEFEGFRKLDGAECVVVRFRLVEEDDTTTPRSQTISEIFWIDLNRGGHVVRRERLVQGENLAERTTARLQRFEARPGRVTWLPVSGRVEWFVGVTKDRKQRVYNKEAVQYMTYELLAPKLRIDQGLKNDAFTLKVRPGDDVSDAVRKARYEFGQYLLRPKMEGRQPTDAEVKGELDRMLKDSKVMASELKASSPAAEGSAWWTIGPWAVAGVALAALGVVGYRRRGG